MRIRSEGLTSVWSPSGAAVLHCPDCEVTEEPEIREHFNPVVHYKYAELLGGERIPYIDHSRENVPSPG